MTGADSVWVPASIHRPISINSLQSSCQERIKSKNKTEKAKQNKKTKKTKKTKRKTSYITITTILVTADRCLTVSDSEGSSSGRLRLKKAAHPSESSPFSWLRCRRTDSSCHHSPYVIES